MRKPILVEVVVVMMMMGGGGDDYDDDEDGDNNDDDDSQHLFIYKISYVSLYHHNVTSYGYIMLHYSIKYFLYLVLLF